MNISDPVALSAASALLSANDCSATVTLAEMSIRCMPRRFSRFVGLGFATPPHIVLGRADKEIKKST